MNSLRYAASALAGLTMLLVCSTVQASAWFETFKDNASPAELHQFLFAMPKGGDLHLHLGGSVFSEWYYDFALAQADEPREYRLG